MNFSMIKAAAARVHGHARVTPLLSSPFLDEIAGRRVWVKAECLQHTGSFKFRGGWAAISALSDDEKRRGVLAYSSGNHAQGVALAAREHGINATIIMPGDAPKTKIENTRALGARVVLYDRACEDRETVSRRLLKDGDLKLIKPFDDPEVIAGQGTVGLELADQLHAENVEKADVLVCCGGGGLTSGIALALEEKAPNFKVRPVEPEDFDDVARSLLSGTIQSNARTSGSICDAILTPAPCALTFGIIQRLCGAGIVVTQKEALNAMAQAYQRLKIVVEPGGAVALAAALYHSNEIAGDDVVCIVTGGNTDPDIFRQALELLE